MKQNILVLAEFRRVRDEIRERVLEWLKSRTAASAPAGRLES
jgi:hypothetical protein